MPLLCYLHFSFIFDKTYVQKNMKTKLIEKAKQISTEYKFGDFFRNFLAVILGIIITFAGSDWITEHNAQKEVKESILLVKSELQTNREDIAYIKELVELEQKGALYLLEYKGRIQEADPDSLQKYDRLPFQSISFNAMYDALEMLKASGPIPKIKNKDLTVQILTAYAIVRNSQSAFDSYGNIKQRCLEELMKVPDVKKRMNSTNYIDWNFYFKYPEGVALIQQIPQIQSTDIYQNHLKAIDKVIAAIDEEYNQ